MTSPIAFLRRGLGAAMIGLAALTGAASAQDVAVVPAARDALPAAIRDAGVLKVATSYQWAPFAFVDDAGKPDGIDLRLVKILAAKLGLEAQFDDLTFPSIIPGVQNGRYDIGVNQMGITAERAAAVDFVPYFRSGYGLLVRNGTTGVDINSLCGHSLSLTQGSAQVAIAEEISADCLAKGNKAIEMAFYPNSAATYMAVANGRGDGFMTARAVGVHIARMNSAQLQMTDALLPNKTTLSGIVVGKGKTELQNALTLALISAHEDGTYQCIMGAFEVPDAVLDVEAIKTPPSF